MQSVYETAHDGVAECGEAAGDPGEQVMQTGDSDVEFGIVCPGCFTRALPGLLQFYGESIQRSTHRAKDDKPEKDSEQLFMGLYQQAVCECAGARKTVFR